MARVRSGKSRSAGTSKKARLGSIAALAGGALAAGSGVGPEAVEAATFTVTNLNDGLAPGTLRQALDDANSAAGADIVDFQAGLTGTITLTGSQLEVADAVDIQGPGAADITVDADGLSRVFYLYSPAGPPLEVTISGLTITGGAASFGAGVINIGENLTLDSVVISGNEATDGGGGVASGGTGGPGGGLTIVDSTISGNLASRGGGVYLYDNLTEPTTITRTAITGNDASSRGGGVYFYGPESDVTIEDSTISGNTALVAGGGVYFYDTDGGEVIVRGTTIANNDAAAGGGAFFYAVDDPVTFESSTISGNSAAFVGGGVYFYNASDGATLSHATISGNSAGDEAGGIYVGSYAVTLDHVIVANNTAGVSPDLGGPADFDVSFSLVEDPSGANVNDNGGNLFTQDPQLGALANNGGPTETQRPAGASPVVNAGDAAFAPPPATDQRGQPRVVGGRIDMGSVEVNPGTIQLAIAADAVAENAGTVAITATRTGGSDGAVSVAANTADGSAVAPADYAAVVAGTFTWGDGVTTNQVINVGIVDDASVEGAQDFTLTISTPTGGAAVGAPATETVTITDNDVAAPGTIQLTASAVSVAENAVTVTITATRTGGDDGAVSVAVNTANGSAIAPGDYGAVVAGSFSWADQDAVDKTLNISIVNDPDVEGDEVFTVTISTPTGGATLGAVTTEAVTILSDPADGSVIAIPTLGETGRMLLIGLVAAAAFVAMRRRKGLAATGLALTLALASEAQATSRGAATIKAVRLEELRIGSDGQSNLRLSDGSTVRAPTPVVEVRDFRDGSSASTRGLKARGRALGRPAGDPVGQAVVIKTRTAPDGTTRRVRVWIYDSLQEAEREAARKALED